jgi:uncharacterized protein
VNRTNLELTQRAYQAALRGSYDDFLALLDENISLELPSCLPHGGSYRGKSGARQLRERLIGSWNAFDVEVLEYLTGPETVIAIIRLQGTLKGADRGVDMRIAEYWRFRDGLVTELRAYYFDTHAVVEAVGSGCSFKPVTP